MACKSDLRKLLYKASVPGDFSVQQIWEKTSGKCHFALPAFPLNVTVLLHEGAHISFIRHVIRKSITMGNIQSVTNISTKYLSLLLQN